MNYGNTEHIQGFIRPTVTAGFTLVETLVAITILLLVIIGPMTVAQKGIQNAYFANEQVTAVFLAQEAIEGIRQERDATALRVYKNLVDPDQGDGLKAEDWLTTELKACRYGCSYDVESREFEQCNEAGTCVLNYADGRYTTELTGTKSPFTRKLYIVDQSATIPGTVSVISEVTWGTRGSVRLQTWLYNHYERYDPD